MKENHNETTYQAGSQNGYIFLRDKFNESSSCWLKVTYSYGEKAKFSIVTESCEWIIQKISGNGGNSRRVESLPA